MRHPILRGLLATAAALALTAAPAFAAPNAPNRGNFTALGDSYAAGVGNDTPIKNAGDSGRTAEAYPVLLAGQVNKVNFVAASGATTQDVIDTQVRHVSRGATQVTLTVGGNDFGVGELAGACLAGLTDPACLEVLATHIAPADLVFCLAQASTVQETCLLGKLQDALATVLQYEVAPNLASVIAALQTQAPNATIFVTGYPLLFQPTPTCGLVSPTLASAIDGATTSLNGAIAGVAFATGATYVPVNFPSGLCTAGPYVGADLHPTAAGQQFFADAVQGAGFVGTP